MAVVLTITLRHVAQCNVSLRRSSAGRRYSHGGSDWKGLVSVTRGKGPDTEVDILRVGRDHAPVWGPVPDDPITNQLTPRRSHCNLCNRIASSLFTVTWLSSCNDRYSYLSARIRNSICFCGPRKCSVLVPHEILVGFLKTYLATDSSLLYL